MFMYEVEYYVYIIYKEKKVTLYVVIIENLKKKKIDP